MCVLCVKKPWGTPRLLESELNKRIAARLIVLLVLVTAARDMYGKDESE